VSTEFVSQLVQYVLEKRVSQTLEAFRNGFLSVIDKSLLQVSVVRLLRSVTHCLCLFAVCLSIKLFVAEEVEVLVCGSVDLDMHELEAIASYEGYSSTHRTIMYVISERLSEYRRFALTFPMYPFFFYLFCFLSVQLQAVLACCAFVVHNGTPQFVAVCHGK